MRKLSRPIQLKDQFAIVQLQHGLTAVIDAEDVTKVAGYTWHALRVGPNRYAVANVRRANGEGWTTLRMHRLITGAERGVEIDHRDGNGLNCTKANLRMATRRENARNVRGHRDSKSKLKGVTLHGGIKPWRARILVDGRQVHLGLFATAEDANAAYAAAALIHYGEFNRPR